MGRNARNKAPANAANTANLQESVMVDIVQMNHQSAYKFVFDSFDSVKTELNTVTQQNCTISVLKMHMMFLHSKLDYFEQNRSDANVKNVWKILIEEFLGFIGSIEEKKFSQNILIIKECFLLIVCREFQYQPRIHPIDQIKDFLFTTITQLHTFLPQVDREIMFYEKNEFKIPINFISTRDNGIFKLFIFGDDDLRSKIVKSFYDFEIKFSANLLINFINYFLCDRNQQPDRKCDQIGKIVGIYNFLQTDKNLQ